MAFDPENKEGLTSFTELPIFTAAVNKPELVKIEGPFGAEALRILRAIPGMTVITRPRGVDRSVDAILRFAGRQTRIAVEIKGRANAATAWQLVHYAEAHPGTPLLLIADQSTAEAREILGNHGIAIVDGLGNVRFKLPGLLLHLEGRRGPSRIAAQGPPTRLNQKAGLVAQALLLNPKRKWRVQDIAREAQVSAGLAHRVLVRLEREEILLAQGTGPNRVRRVANPTALLDLWTEENLESPNRTLGHLLTQTPQQLTKQLGANLGRSGIDYALTGAAAASLLAPFVTGVPVVEVWVRATAAPAALYEGAKADRVTEGHNVVFLQTKDDGPLLFREKAKELWIANRFRVYADLCRDPRRGKEQAEHLRREVIQF